MSHHDKSETRDLSHLTKIDVIDVAAAVEADKLTDAEVFKRTYLGHGSQSSVFVFQGHAGPFRSHVHETHDEIGYVLEGTGSSIGDEMNSTCGASSNWPPCGVFAGITQTSPFLTGRVTPPTVTEPVPSST